MTIIMGRLDSIVISLTQLIFASLQLDRVTVRQGGLDGIFFHPMIQRGLERCSGSIAITRTLSSLKACILALLPCVSWKFGMTSRHAPSFNMKGMRSSSLRGVHTR
jgi:hypothetical protein